MIKERSDVGGWVGIAAEGSSRPHASLDVSPPAGVSLAPWCGITIGDWRSVRGPADHFGAVLDQCAAELAVLEEMADRFVETFRENWDRNYRAIESLAPGTRVQFTGWGGPYPERTREQILDLYF
jgi:hypothetical protein